MIHKSKWVLLFFILSLLTVSCHRQEKDELCLTKVLDRYGMTQYEGEKIGCRMFLTMYEYNNKLYFELGNHCADMYVVVRDCAGIDIKDIHSKWFVMQFDNHAIRVGVVGIE